jgi:hypothetical protein
MMFDVDQAKFDEGRRAYAAGTSVRDVVAVIEREHAAADADQKGWREHKRAADSFVLGFVEGLVGDIRRIAGNTPRGVRA